MSAALYADVARDAGMSVRAVRQVLRSLSIVAGWRLRQEKTIKIPNIAKIVVTGRKEMPPRQKCVFGKLMQISRRPARNRIKFVVSKPLKDAVEG